ncbi:hypothetical protein SLS62_009540 [Diatrype stigma]|uniref:NAD(P)-binding domain-containing protein n=1 Tax=Diatrype stigma TaxID=117547 RepID=A0AAN9UGM4_9PEZI
MSTKIFLTGATGYIGGDALYALYEAHPEFEYALLVRNEEKGKQVAAAYPRARLVYGELDDDEVISREAAAADIVVHTANSADNMPSAKAIAKGLAAGHPPSTTSTSTPSKPGYWLHVCGTGMLMHHDKIRNRYGQAPAEGELYHDIDDIGRIVNFADEALHRDVDKVVLASNSPEEGGVRTLIVSPPCIYGAGRGPGNRRSVQVNRLAALALARGGRAPVQRPGLTEWDHVHVRDLSAFFVLAVEAAVSSSSNPNPNPNNNPEIFGPHGYFFLESGSHRWSDVARWVAESAARQGFVPAGQEARVEEVDDFYFFGMNARSVAARARRYLGWEPVAPGLREEIDEIVAVEAEVLRKNEEKQEA